MEKKGKFFTKKGFIIKITTNVICIFVASLSITSYAYQKGGAENVPPFCVQKKECRGLCPQLYNGDCLEVMQDIQDKSVDMVLCDLPYGMTDCKWDSIIPFDKLWEQYNRIVKENGAIVLFSAQPFTTKLIQSNLKHFKYCWYWIKPYSTGFCFAKYQPMRRVEDICVFYRKGGSYYPQGLKEIKNAKPKQSKAGNIYGRLDKEYTPKYTNYPTNILKYDGVKNRLHPTQKPVELLEYLIKTYTRPGEIVLDNCMGSGSTGEAAKNTGRRFIGIEKDINYYEIAKERIKG